MLEGRILNARRGRILNARREDTTDSILPSSILLVYFLVNESCKHKLKNYYFIYGMVQECCLHGFPVRWER